MTLDTQTLRETLGLFVTGVTIITTRDASGQPVGITANSFNSVSLDPPLVLWSIGKSSRSLAAFELSTYFAVHILGEEQIDLSRQFARSGANKFEGLKTTRGLGGVPLIEDCAARLECSIYGRHPAGDHIIFVAEIERMESTPTSGPLVYHDGQYALLADQ